MGEVIPLFPLGSPLFPGVLMPLHVFEPRYRRLVRDLLQRPEDEGGRFFGVVAIRQGWEVESVAPAEALYDIGCTARLQTVQPQPDGGFGVVTVGGDRFRLLDVLVDDEPPYLQGEVEWLADEEAAEEAAGDAEELVGPPGEAAPGPGPAGEADAAGLEELAASVARASLAVLVRSVSGLFGSYVAAVAGLRPGDDDGTAPEDDDGTAALLRAAAGDPRALSYLVASAALLTTEDRQALLAESATRRRLAAESRLLRRELTLLRTIGAVPVSLRDLAGPRSVN